MLLKSFFSLDLRAVAFFFRLFVYFIAKQLFAAVSQYRQEYSFSSTLAENVCVCVCALFSFWKPMQKEESKKMCLWNWERIHPPQMFRRRRRVYGIILFILFFFSFSFVAYVLRWIISSKAATVACAPLVDHAYIIIAPDAHISVHRVHLPTTHINIFLLLLRRNNKYLRFMLCLTLT